MNKFRGLFLHKLIEGYKCLFYLTMCSDIRTGTVSKDPWLQAPYSFAHVVSNLFSLSLWLKQEEMVCIF